MDLDLSYPALSDLARRARRRMPHFAWEYLDSGTGDDRATARSVAALDEILFLPRTLGGCPPPDLSVTLFGTRYDLPVGFAPVGMAGLMWPGAEGMLARTAAARRVPFCLSTAGSATPEETGPLASGMGWFQLYPPSDPAVRRDLIARARDAGFTTLVLTADLPVASRRERQRRAGIQWPPKITPSIFLQCAIRPEWTARTLLNGRPHQAVLTKYIDTATSRVGGKHASYEIRTTPDLDYLRAVREEWDGPLLVKGVLDPEGAREAVGCGADGVWVSSHGGRQLDSAPAPAWVLPEIRAAVGPGVPVIYDSGIRSGSHLLAAIALGADMCMIGRAALWGVASFAERGAHHVLDILAGGLTADLGQLGIARASEASSRRFAQ